MTEQEQKNKGLITQEKDKLKIYNPGDIILDNYQVINEIGRGGMNSIVYKAIDLKSQNKLRSDIVAIKVIYRDPSQTDNDWNRFHDEYITAFRVKNIPNIVQTYRVIKSIDNKKITIIMEYVEGYSLRKVLTDVGTLNVEEALFIFKKIIIALNGLHSFSQKIIHRDLKPENILLSKDRTNVKIIDFGISSVLRVENKNDRKLLTKEENVFGTYPYLSPDITQLLSNKEQYKKATYINEQCDFYAAGVILYEMIFGEKPFLATDYEDSKIITLPLKYDIPAICRNNPSIPIAVENIIYRCMASKPEDIKYRYSSAKEILEDIEDAFDTIDCPTEGILIKPYEKRTFQNSIFDIQKTKNKEKFYTKQWFYWTMCIFVITITIIALIILLVNNV